MAEYYGNICTCRKCNGIVHTIRRGDTLYLLSRHYNVTINEIMRANSNVNVYNLQVGDQICIPVKRPAPSQPNILGQLLNQNQTQGQGAMQGRPSVIQPRMEEEQMEEEMNSQTMMEGETNIEYADTSANAEANDSETIEVSAECCGNSSMRVKDLIQDENMTLEEFARMLKNM